YGLVNQWMGSNTGRRLPTRQPSHCWDDCSSPRRSKMTLTLWARCGAVSRSHASISLKVKPESSMATTQRWASRRPANTRADPPGLSTRSHWGAHDLHHSQYCKGMSRSAADQPFRGFPRFWKTAPAFCWAGLEPRKAELVLA